MAKILIVDDNGSIRRILSEILETRNYTVRSVGTGRACLEIVAQEDFDLILLDIKMQGMDGLEVLKELKFLGVTIPIIMMSAHGRSGTAKEVMLSGAFNYIEKPFNQHQILEMIAEALEHESLGSSDLKTPILARKQKPKIGKTPTRKAIGSENKTTLTMIGSCPSFIKMKERIAKIAPNNFRVLINGPNGAGKELVARSIHALSLRSKKRFVEVNCAAIPSELIESQLFGHTRGSFTGANKETVGLFQQADGGTIFLDEIGDMSLSAQTKVLRVLQENKITKVGGDRDININVRVLAATNKNLLEQIQAKTFRLDLYHRLNELNIVVPSLNERRADIPLLIHYFVNLYANQNKWTVPKIEKEAMDALEQLNYSGNIRQLQNIVKRMLVFCGPVVTVTHVNEQLAPLDLNSQREVIDLQNLIQRLGGMEAAITYIRANFK